MERTRSVIMTSSSCVGVLGGCFVGSSNVVLIRTANENQHLLFSKKKKKFLNAARSNCAAALIPLKIKINNTTFVLFK